MKKLLIVIFTALAVMAVAGCKKAATHKSTYVPPSGISLNYSSETLAIGGELQLYATVEPSNATNKTVTWESSKNNVASVEGGLVKAVGVGDAEITARCGGVSATCNIHVIAEEIHVTAISLSPEEDVIKVGGTTRFNVRFEPANATNHNVTWESSDSDIARIDDSGLITGVSRGTVTITARSVDGNKPATATLRVAQPFTKITLVKPDESDAIHYSEDGYRFFVGESIQLQAKGEPEEADDEIEFIGIEGASYFDLSDDGLLEPTAYRTFGCKVVARSKADNDVKAELVFKIYERPTGFKLSMHYTDAEVYLKRSDRTVRSTEYIGRGATQKFTVDVIGKSPNEVSLKSVSMSGVSASLTDHVLTVSVPSTATASTTTSTRQFSVTLEGPGGFTQAINFKISLYDPYKVKIGDLISREGNFFDGGYRGNGLFENSAYIDHTAGDGFNSILAWLGNKHMTEDPFWSQSAPSGAGLKDVQGNVYHGIAIPVNIDRLYRKTEPNGEYYYDEDGNNNFILDSGNLPGSWVNSDDRKDLLRSTSDKHSAIFNTAVHVYTNEGRGKSWEIRPANFFVDVYNRYPGESSGKTINKGNYSFYGSFSYNSLFNEDEDNGSGLDRYMTQWLWPTIADFYSIFTGGDTPAGLAKFTTNKTYTVSEKRRSIFVHSAKQANNTLTYDYYWWLANESGRDMSGNLRLTQATIDDNTDNLLINTNVLPKSDSWKAYVLPIRYF